MSRLAEAYARLDGGQRRAVDYEGDTVVLAGPGSGKTETLAVKAASLLQHIDPPRGVACITYTRAAAGEIRYRVAELGASDARRLVAGTLHSFCLRQILRPYAALLGSRPLTERQVIGQRQSSQILRTITGESGVVVSSAELQVMRRAATAGEYLSAQFSEAQLYVMDRYEAILDDGHLIDFDGIVHETVRLTAENPIVVELTAARFPWLLIDEYQDLGAPLHLLVQTLRESGDINLFAVGDPDQTILQFTGADARYIESLEAAGYTAIVLPINCRCAPEIVRAAAGAVDRGYRPDPAREDPGEVVARAIPGGMSAQVRVMVEEILPHLLARFAHDEIAILYPQRSWYADQIVRGLTDAGIPFSLERDARFSQLGEVVSWLQECAQWAVTSEERRRRFRDLADRFKTYLEDARHPAAKTALAAAELLYRALEGPVEPGTPLVEWLEGIVQRLDLAEVLRRGEIYAQDLEALTELSVAVKADPDLVISDFAGPVRQPGRVIVTTYHSAKGRQFDAVILPGLQDGVMPRSRKRRGRWVFNPIVDESKLFYVAMTRARHSLVLLWSPSAESAYGDAANWGPSRFLEPVLAQLK